jgi:hypothetical protein
VARHSLPTRPVPLALSAAGEYRKSKFCLAPYGYGYGALELRYAVAKVFAAACKRSTLCLHVTKLLAGMRLHQSIIGGCVPLIIQEHVFQPFEDVSCCAAASRFTLLAFKILGIHAFAAPLQVPIAPLVFVQVLPYEEFSVRLNNADLPHLREILRSITDEQYLQLLAGLVRYRHAFTWEVQLGGRAFDYTIATLRRRYMNLKAMYAV